MFNPDLYKDVPQPMTPEAYNQRFLKGMIEQYDELSRSHGIPDKSELIRAKKTFPKYRDFVDNGVKHHYLSQTGIPRAHIFVVDSCDEIIWENIESIAQISFCAGKYEPIGFRVVAIVRS